MSTSPQNISLLPLHWAQSVSSIHTLGSAVVRLGTLVGYVQHSGVNLKNHRVMKKLRRMVTTWSVRKCSLLCSPSDCKLNNPLNLRCLDGESSTGPGSLGQKASRSCKHLFTWSLLSSRCLWSFTRAANLLSRLFPSLSNKQHPSSSDLLKRCF